jgi:hypothetical protein
MLCAISPLVGGFLLALDHNQRASSQNRRQAALETFVFQALLPPERTARDMATITLELQQELANGNPAIRDTEATVDLLSGDDLLRLVQIQETWVTEALGETPTPNRFPWVLEVHSPRARIDPVASQALTRHLQELAPHTIVVHDQLALDSVLAEQREAIIEENQRSQLILAATGLLAITALLMGWMILEKRIPRLLWTMVVPIFIALGHLLPFS